MHGPHLSVHPEKRKGKKWGTGLSAAVRKKKSRKKLCVKWTPPTRRCAQLREHIQHGVVTGKQREKIAKLAKQIFATGVKVKTGRFGQATGVFAADHKSLELVKMLFAETAGTGIEGVAIEGLFVPSVGSPWLLQTQGDSPLHDDVSGQENRSIPGRHLDFMTLFYVVECDPVEFPSFHIFAESAVPQRSRSNFTEGNCTKMFQNNLQSGSWVIFPAKCCHLVRQPDKCRKNRLIFSAQFRHGSPAGLSAETGQGESAQQARTHK